MFYFWFYCNIHFIHCGASEGEPAIFVDGVNDITWNILHEGRCFFNRKLDLIAPLMGWDAYINEKHIQSP